MATETVGERTAMEPVSRPGAQEDILLIADFGRSAQGWLSYLLSYVLNARFIEPYACLSGARMTSSRVIEANIRGALPGRAPSRYAMVVKTHGYPSADFGLTRSIIYLTRDPRDVAVSHFFLHRKWLRDGSRSPMTLLYALPVISYFVVAYRWRRHFRRWQHVDVYRVRYEDLRHDTEKTLRTLLTHFGSFVDPALIRQAIELFSFENAYGRKRGVEDRNNPEARKGQIGDYRNHFSGWMNIVFWRICGSEAETAGYRADGSTTVEPKGVVNAGLAV